MFRFTLMLCICGSGFASFGQSRTVETLTAGWKFYKGSVERAQEVNYNDQDWVTVSLPHDWGVDSAFIPDGDANTGKLPWKGEGWYRTTLDLPESASEKQLYLICDGIMAFPEIYINGHLAGKWDYGYNSFHVEITKFVNPGRTNILAIHADTRNHDSRWYPGGGIYRKIRLLSVDPIHIDIWGTSITTPRIKPNRADVVVETIISTTSTTATGPVNPLDSIQVAYAIENAAGQVVARATQWIHPHVSGRTIAEATLTLASPHRWDITNPYLYTLRTEILVDGHAVDSQAELFGIRTMRFTADDGFYLNERRVQLKGVNLHHDHGPLGAAFNTRAMERQLEIMQGMGCNAIRTSHNIPAPELLDLCDRMGLLVIDEIFDKYDGKADISDTTDFAAFAERNVRNWIMRDRNHPCIILWSVGNEIGDVQWNRDGGFRKLRTMVNLVNKYDFTRPTTLVCDSKQSAELRHFDYYDVHAWNYGRRYTLARQFEPNKSVIISESASTLSTRGFYEFPLPAKKTDFTNSLQVSSYDLNAPWWAEVADDDFMWQQEEPYVAGEFVWTGFDYLGEPTPYDNRWAHDHGMSDEAASRSSYFGIVDLCGIPKDRYYLYQSYWKPEEDMVHILPHWNWQGIEGEPVTVMVYTNGDCAELFLNGKSLGMQCKQPSADSSIYRFRLIWNDVTYAPGELKALAYRAGQKIGEQVVKTAGPPAHLRVTPDRTMIKADGQDLSYLLIEALDKDGNPCPLADDLVTITMDGPGTIAGVGNGDPQSFAPFKSNQVKLFFGKAMLIMRRESARDACRITCSSAGLTEAQVTIHAAH